MSLTIEAADDVEFVVDDVDSEVTPADGHFRTSVPTLRLAPIPPAHRSQTTDPVEAAYRHTRHLRISKDILVLNKRPTLAYHLV